MPSPSSCRPGRTTTSATLLLAVVAALVLQTLSPGTADPAGATARVAADRQAQQLTLTRTSAADVVAGDTVAFTGTATRRLLGRKIRLQRRVGDGGWVEVAVGRIGADGSYVVAAGAAGGGANEWRTLAKTKAKRKHGKVRKPARTVVSNKVSTSVFQWYFLTDLDTVDDEGDWNHGTATIGGQFYDKSAYSESWNRGWGDYNLGYKCSQLAFSFGIGDGSTTGAQAEFFLTRDGSRVSLGAKAMGRATDAIQPVNGVLRIRLETVVTSAYTSVTAAYGSPRVLCSAKP